MKINTKIKENYPEKTVSFSENNSVHTIPRKILDQFPQAYWANDGAGGRSIIIIRGIANNNPSLLIASLQPDPEDDDKENVPESTIFLPFGIFKSYSPERIW